LDYLNKTIGLNPFFGDIYFYKGRMLFEMFQIPDAIEQFKNALNHSFNLKDSVIMKSEILFSLYNSYIQTNDNDNATQVYKEYVKQKRKEELENI